MNALKTENLRAVLESLSPLARLLDIDWHALGETIPASQALQIVESACKSLSRGEFDDALDKHVIVPLARFNRVRWYAAPDTRALMMLFYDVTRDEFNWLQGEFRHIEKNDPRGRRSRCWDGEFVNWALQKLKENRAEVATSAREAETQTAAEAPLPDVEPVNLAPLIGDLTNRLGYGRIFAGRLRADWWPSEDSIKAAVARGVPIGFARRSLFVQSFISVHTQQRHSSTTGADELYVEYIVDSFQTLLQVAATEIEHEESSR